MFSYTLQDYYNTGDNNSLAIYGDGGDIQTFISQNTYLIYGIRLKLSKDIGGLNPGIIRTGIVSCNIDGSPVFPYTYLISEFERTGF